MKCKELDDIIDRITGFVAENKHHILSALRNELRYPEMIQIHKEIADELESLMNDWRRISNEFIKSINEE